MPKVITQSDDAGFTIAEAVVSAAMTLIVVGAALQALNAAARVTDVARIVSDTNQSIEVAMSLMVRDFVQTGEAIPRGGIPLPAGPGITPINRPKPPATAFTFATASSTLPALTPGGSMGPVVLGVSTDIATLLYADPTLQLNQWPLAAIAADGSTMTVDARTPITGPDGLKVGDLVLFSNAFGTAVQMITAVSGAQTVTFGALDPLNFNQRTATSGSVMQLQSTPGVYPTTVATRINMVSYYIDTTSTPGVPCLVRQLNNGPRLAIAQGVENLQFSYDLIDGVTNPANLESVVLPNSPNQIRKVNLFILARSLDRNQETRDFFRNSTATSVGLRSLTYVDRYR